MTNCESFSYVANRNSKILILGSMPGIKSLNAAQYYAHPHNRFWKLMGKICNNENIYKMPYEEKIKLLLQNGYALWDVIKTCQRDGSLDVNIKNEMPNDILKLLQTHKNIQKICLNGSKAQSAFKKYFPELYKKYDCRKLPSTSPANARYTFEDLYKEWEKALKLK